MEGIDRGEKNSMKADQVFYIEFVNRDVWQKVPEKWLVK